MDLAELLTLPGMREECILRSTVGFMALHGGSQDRGTDHIARRAAELAGASYYASVQPTPSTRRVCKRSWGTSTLPSRCTDSGAKDLPSGSIPTAAW